MTATHIVRQNENMARIAKQYKISNWRDIYEHPTNAKFRQLRPNPNIINPGDRIFIPDIEPKSVKIQTGRVHSFVVQRQVQKLTLSLKDSDQKPIQNAKVMINLPSSKEPVISDESGNITIEVTPNDPLEFTLDIFEAEEINAKTVTVTLSALDSPESISGLQARLNALGFPAGRVDGLMGIKTRTAIKAFQKAHGNLPIDGEPGPTTINALETAYGC